MLEFVNLSLHILHLSIITFNLFAWIWPLLRRAHLVSILLTFVSWFGLGIFYGWGYCPVTDLHWQVQRKMGIYDMPGSYIKLIVDTVSGLNSDPFLIDVLTLSLFLIAFILAVYFNFFQSAKTKR